MMVTLEGIQKAVVGLLKADGHKVHGNEVLEGFERPSFFVELTLVSANQDTMNYASNKLIVTINYFHAVFTRLDDLRTADRLRKLFKMHLQVESRCLLIRDARITHAGEKNDILQYSFDLDYFEVVDKPDDQHDKMQVLNIRRTLNERG